MIAYEVDSGTLLLFITRPSASMLAEYISSTGDFRG